MGKPRCRFRVQVDDIVERGAIICSRPLFHDVNLILPTNVQAMTMQSAVVYGRLIASHARQLVAPLLKRQTSELRLITACCGFSKDFRPAKSKFVFGEDAFFVAKTKHSDVLGK